VPVRVIAFSDPLPRNPAGKVLKDQLRRIAENEPSFIPEQRHVVDLSR
jgi:acyl-coenzyme A synthetase/AMP-(fatty) acid ligase